MSMRDRDLPARTPWPCRLERYHVAIIEMGTAPDLEIEIGEIDRFRVGDAQHHQVRKRSEVPEPKHRIWNGGVVVARQENHRHPGCCDHDGGTVEHMLRQAMAFERVAHEQDYVRTDRASCREHTRQACSSVA